MTTLYVQLYNLYTHNHTIMDIKSVRRGDSKGFDRTPYFCSLKLILSLNIKY